MPYKATIAHMKVNRRENAFDRALAVHGIDGRRQGLLVPVGNWVLQDRELVEQLALWRKRAMRFFLSQFKASIESTASYLKNLSIGESGRLLFLIYDDGNRLIGHIGLADVDGECGELDNLMRGASGGHPQLMSYAESTLLDWAFEELALTRVDLRVLSFNVFTIALHTAQGFELVKSVPLLKEQNEDVITHREVGETEANVDYRCNYMSLSRQSPEKTV